MKIQVTKEDLSKAVAACLPSTDARGTMPVLACVLLKATGKLVGVDSTDLETHYSGSCPGMVKAPGVVVVNARTLEKLIKTLPKKSVITLSANGDKNLTVECGATWKIPGTNPDEVPPVPLSEVAVGVDMAAATLLDLINKTLFSAYTGDLEYHIAGVHWENIAGRLRAAATDGHRLTIMDGPEYAPLLPFDEKGFIGSSVAMRAMAIFLKGQETVNVLLADRLLILTAQNGHRLFIRTPAGVKSFPDCRRIIPKAKHIKNVVMVPRHEMIDAISRITAPSKDHFKGIVLTFRGDTLTLTLSDPELGEAQATVKAPRIKGEGNFMIGFNARYLAEPLSRMTGEFVELAGTDPDRPWQIICEADPGYLTVIMPMCL